MRIVNPNDTVEFIDELGDKLICLKSPRHRAVGLRKELVLEESSKVLKVLKEFDDTALTNEKIEEAKKAKEAKKSKGEKKDDFTTTAIREFEFLAVVLKIIIKEEKGERVIEGDENLLQAYRDSDETSGKWIDEKISEIWDSSQPSDAEKKSPSK